MSTCGYRYECTRKRKDENSIVKECTAEVSVYVRDEWMNKDEVRVNVELQRKGQSGTMDAPPLLGGEKSEIEARSYTIMS